MKQLQLCIATVITLASRGRSHTHSLLMHPARHRAPPLLGYPPGEMCTSKLLVLLILVLLVMLLLLLLLVLLIEMSMGD